MTDTSTVSFRIVSRGRAPSPQAHRPRQRPAAGMEDMIGTGAGVVRVLLTAAAKQRLSELCRKNLPDEAGGILGGLLGEDDHGPFTVVDVVEEVEPEHVGSAHVHWTGAAINRARARLTSLPSRPDLVGWWHSHQNMQAFFSSEDRREQATWRDERNVGIVVGRGGHQFAAFHGPDASPLDLLPAVSLDRARLARLWPTGPFVWRGEFNLERVPALIAALIEAQDALFDELRGYPKALRRSLLVSMGVSLPARGHDLILSTRMLLRPRGSLAKRLRALRDAWQRSNRSQLEG